MSTSPRCNGAVSKATAAHSGKETCGYGASRERVALVAEEKVVVNVCKRHDKAGQVILVDGRRGVLPA